jgi:hypothetical protein
VRLENDGTVTSAEPKDDPGFLQELEAFSAEQGQKLCLKKSICGTQDAHWARYAKPAPPPPEPFDWKTESRFKGKPVHYGQIAPMTATGCRNACVNDLRCVAVEHDSVRNACSLYDRLTPVERVLDRVRGSRWSVGIRERSPLHWHVDLMVDEAKAARTCSVFTTFPKIVRPPIWPYAPTDVGIKTKR